MREHAMCIKICVEKKVELDMGTNGNAACSTLHMSNMETKETHTHTHTHTHKTTQH